MARKSTHGACTSARGSCCDEACTHIGLVRCPAGNAGCWRPRSRLRWVSRSESALRWGIAKLGEQLPCRLTVQGLSGSLSEPIRIQRLVCESDALRVDASQVELDWSPWALMRERLDVASLRAATLVVEARDKNQGPLAVPTDLALPLAVHLGRLELGTVTVESSADPIVLREIDASYDGDARSHRLLLRRLTSPWGSVQQGELQLGAQAPLPLSAKLQIESASDRGLADPGAGEPVRGAAANPGADHRQCRPASGSGRAHGRAVRLRSSAGDRGAHRCTRPQHLPARRASDRDPCRVQRCRPRHRLGVGHADGRQRHARARWIKIGCPYATWCRKQRSRAMPSSSSKPSFRLARPAQPRAPRASTPAESPWTSRPASWICTACTRRCAPRTSPARRAYRSNPDASSSTPICGKTTCACMRMPRSPMIGSR